MQLEELLDKLKEETNKKKHDIAIKHKTCNVRELRAPCLIINVTVKKKETYAIMMNDGIGKLGVTLPSEVGCM